MLLLLEQSAQLFLPHQRQLFVVKLSNRFGIASRRHHQLLIVALIAGYCGLVVKIWEDDGTIGVNTLLIAVEPWHHI